MTENLLTLRLGADALSEALHDCAQMLRAIRARLGAPAPGTLRRVAAIAGEVAATGEPILVGGLTADGQLTDVLAVPSGRLAWPVSGESWPAAVQGLEAALIEASCIAQKEGAGALPSHGAGAEMLMVCYELESAYRVN